MADWSSVVNTLQGGSDGLQQQMLYTEIKLQPMCGRKSAQLHPCSRISHVTALMVSPFSQPPSYNIRFRTDEPNEISTLHRFDRKRSFDHTFILNYQL